jgi:hypothetical protein
VGVQSNAQRETQLLAEWLGTLPAYFQSKTHIWVGKETLMYQGAPLPPARVAAFRVWSDWVDARVFTGAEVWLVEATLVGVAGKYGQVLWYANEYPDSPDYRQFMGAPIVPVVLAAGEKRDVAVFFSRFGIRTIPFTPVWAAKSIAVKIVGSTVEL